MLRRAYDKTLDLAGDKRAPAWLFWISVIESSVFPIPPDVMLVPMCLKDRARAFRFALLATMGSVLGGLIGYAIGMFFWAAIGEPLIAFYGLTAKFAAFQQGFAESGFFWIFFFGLTVFPYKLITIASGFAALDPLLFVLASLASRGLRFFAEAALLWRFGDTVRRFVERHLGLTFTAALLFVLATFLIFHYFGE
ncbi:MAG TPA: YqaA family protein [Sphingomonadales bacterium]|nr:YqaA family protein [Sphingomonadales bacterium]